MIPCKYSASTSSSPDPACSHMTKYSSKTGLGEPEALSKHLQDVAMSRFCGTNPNAYDSI